jgi:hypothetical protein
LFFVALIVIANHCFSLVYSQCPKGSKDLGKKCDGDEDCCNRDDPSDASLVCHHNGLFDTECTQFTCEVGTQKIAELQSKIVAVGAACSQKALVPSGQSLGITVVALALAESAFSPMSSLEALTTPTT